MEFNKKALTAALQDLYKSDHTTTVQLLLQDGSLASFFNSVQGLLQVLDSLRLVVQRVSSLRGDLLEQKQDLAARKTDKQNLVTARDLQRQSLEDVKKEKSTLFTKTKGQEKKFQELLKTTKKNAAQVRNKIFQFLGGGQLSFGEAYQLAKLAEEAVGVRASFVLAVLDREKFTIVPGPVRLVFAEPIPAEQVTAMSAGDLPQPIERGLNRKPR